MRGINMPGISVEEAGLLIIGHESRTAVPLKAGRAKVQDSVASLHVARASIC
jgi:hypothetical protein